jgi:hypothetical protein
MNFNIIRMLYYSALVFTISFGIRENHLLNFNFINHKETTSYILCHELTIEVDFLFLRVTLGVLIKD